MRQIAAAHRRTLPELPEALPAWAAASQPPEPPALSPDLETLASLSAQIVLLQQRLAQLTQVLSCVAVAASPSPEEPAVAPEASTSAPAAPRPRPAASSSAKPPRESARVLPLVEYGTDGGYVVISPKHGLLTLEPDSPGWFAWLATQSSFRFVGRSGRLTAHREVQRLPQAAWRAHRKIRNHTSNVRLGSTQSLTMAALEQAAADLQAHLA